MKTLISILLLVSISMGIAAQTTNPTLTIVLKGNYSRELIIDGKDYTPQNLNSLYDAVVTITDLAPGQHQLEVTREGSTRAQNRDVSTEFILRANYDKKITITANGGLQQQESLHREGYSATGGAITDAQFRSLYISVQQQRGSYNRKNRLLEILDKQYNLTSSHARQLISLVASQRYRTDLAKEAYGSVVDKWNYYKEVSPLIRSQSGKNEINDYINSYTATDNANDNHNAGTRVPMSDINYRVLFNEIQSRPSMYTRNTLITNAFNNTAYYFTTDQVYNLISLVDDQSSRLELAKLSYRTVTDVTNFVRVFDLLNTQAYRDQLSSYLRSNYGVITNVKTAMSTADFDNIYRNVQYTFGFGAKYSALRDIFSNTSYYFTVAQAEQLIRLVSDEDNRLALAKLAYARLVDPSNLSAMYDMFSNQSSVDQLKAHAGIQ